MVQCHSPIPPPPHHPVPSNPLLAPRVSSRGEEGQSLLAEDAGAPPAAASPLSLDSALQERLQQERASLQSQMELLERRKDQEMQNLKTSLIAEQQVRERGRERGGSSEGFDELSGLVGGGVTHRSSQSRDGADVFFL